MRLALFDLDNTLLSGDSDFEWGQFLIHKGVLDKTAHEEKNRRFYQEYSAGTLDILEFLKYQLAPLASHSRPQLNAWHHEFMENHILPIISQAARNKVNQHRLTGDLCALVTATNSFVTAPIARELGIPHLIATIPATEGGAFTGTFRGIPAFQEGKVHRVEAWLESLGLWWGDFKEAWFYSDSQNDLPLLEKASHPVAVDPDPVLRRLAEQRHWEIISLRKDSATEKANFSGIPTA